MCIVGIYFKSTVIFQVQGGIPSLVPYGEQTGMPLSVSIPTLTSQPIKPQSASVSNSTKTDDAIQTTSESSSVPPPPPLVAAVTIAPHNQDLLQQIGLAAKDRLVDLVDTYFYVL